MRLRRKLKHLNEALEALDQKLRLAKGDTALAFSRLSPTEVSFVREEITSCLTSRVYYLENYHVIQQEDGTLSTLHPIWDLQALIENAIAKERARTLERDGVGHCKIVVLKPRQTGGTEFANAVMCHATFFTPQAFTLTVAQDIATAAWVQRKVTTAWFHLPWWLQPERQYITKGEHLEFQRKDEFQRQLNPGLGSVFVTTHAERGAGVAIGKSVRFLHGTEVSRWGSGDIYTADIEPSMNAPDELAIMESASLDDRGFFVSLWKEATEDPDSDWVPVFLPVYRARKYTFPKFPAKLAKPISPPLTEYELATRVRVLAEEKFNIPDEFFNWRRLRIKLATKRDGNPYAYYAAYPMTPKEAFQSSGNGAFPRHKLDLQEQNLRPVIFAGEILFQGINAAPKPILEEVQPGQILLKRDALGTSRLHIWELPQRGEIYYIGADTALGRENGDNSAATVWRAGRGRNPDVQVAEWYGKIPPTDWAKTLYALGWWYGKAEISCEYAAEGMTTANVLMNDLDYPALYRPRSRDKVGGNQLAHYLHWSTTMKTKPLIVAQMVEALLEDTVKINSQLLIDEMRKFGVTSISATGYTSYAALDGHDDSTMASMIGLFCLREIMPELRQTEYSLDPSARSQTKGAKAAGGGNVYGIFDQYTRMRGQERDLLRAQEICKKNPGWQIRPIAVMRANTAFSVIHHQRGAENEMLRSGIDSKEILPGAIQAWKGAKVEGDSDADGFQEMVTSGDWAATD